MDPVKILKRAWYILWSYRALWVFGLILAIATAGSSGGSSNNGTQYQFDDENQQMPLPQDWESGIREFNREMERLFNEGPQHVDIPRGELTALIWIVVIFVLVMIVLGIVVAVARYVSETAVIRMVEPCATAIGQALRDRDRPGPALPRSAEPCAAAIGEGARCHD